jgi:phosphoenolpyruvate carboxylase
MANQSSATHLTAEQPGVDKDAPLKEDIRLLGRLLGDVLRDQEGEEVYAVVETIRQTAVRFRREADAGAAKELDGMLKILTREQTISVVRAFSYFLAPGQHRRRPAPHPPPPRPPAGRLEAAARQRQLRAVQAEGSRRPADTVSTFFRTR